MPSHSDELTLMKPLILPNDRDGFTAPLTHRRWCQHILAVVHSF